MRPGATHPESHNALAKGQRLDEFEILGTVGVGGFGIVYSAHDHALQREVALKEYLPASLAGRGAQQQVSVLSQSHAETFAVGLRSFIGEARMLARFDHPGLLKVHRFWEANGTAYMVMPMLHGHTLRALRQAMAESPDEAWLRQLLDGLLGPLEVLHQAEVFHRDIAPDNIHIATNGAPILLDFGAARQVIAGRSQDLTAMLKPSYAPIEQYGQAPGLRQGAWTDLYALGATLHYLIQGAAPPPAPVRAMSPGGPGLAATQRAGYSTGFLGIVDWMLAPHPAHRPQSVAQLRAALAGQSPVPPAAAATAPSDPPWPRTEVPVPPPGPAAAAAVDDDATVLQPRAATTPAAAPMLAAALGSPPPPAAGASAIPAIPAAPGKARPASALPSSAGRLRLALGALLLMAAAALVWVLTRPAAPLSIPAPAAPSAVARAADPPAAPSATPSAPTAAATSTATAAMTDIAAAKPATPMPAPAAADPAPAVAAGAAGPATAASARRAAAVPGASASGGRAAGARQAQGATAGAAAALSTETRSAPATPQAAAPATAATPPAPGPANPAPTAAAAPASPGSPDEACGKRVFIALHQCLLRECARPAFQGHASCIALRRMEEQNRPRDLQ